jgi:hypothetical protein
MNKLIKLVLCVCDWFNTHTCDLLAPKEMSIKINPSKPCDFICVLCVGRCMCVFCNVWVFLVFTVFCIVCTCVLYCFVYVYLFSFVLSVIV